MSNRLWVLGAPDVEMATIERLLTDAGECIAYATVEGVRVHPGNAYKATDFTMAGDPLGSHHGPAWGSVTHLVECGTEIGCLSDSVVRCDHHRPGDLRRVVYRRIKIIQK